jgi:acetyltransferase-like isoleucine patch superfamily enzyme
MSEPRRRRQVQGQFSVVSDDCEIGKGALIWNLVYIGKGVKIGAGVSIGSLVHISDSAVIGDGTLIEGSVHISRYSVIGKDCFIGPNAALTSDPFPPVRRKTGVAAWAGPVLEDNVIVGANAVVRAGVRIGHGSVIGMGAVVLKDVPPEVVVVGSPARIIYTRADYNRRQREWVEATESASSAEVGADMLEMVSALERR